MNEPFVMLGCPIARNREWVIEEYLSAIHNLDYPKKKIHLAFFVNGKPEDRTEEYLFEYKTKFEHEYNNIDIWVMDDKNTDQENREGRDFEHFSNIRNTWISMRRKDDEYIFSVDSDIIIPPETLKKLLSHNKEVVSALIRNGSAGPYELYNIFGASLIAKTGNDNYIHMYDPMIRTQGLITVDVTGACYIIHRDVLDAGAHYGRHLQGEDIYFCEKVKDLGYQIYCDQDLMPDHIMTREEHGQSLSRL